MEGKKRAYLLLPLLGLLAFAATRAYIGLSTSNKLGTRKDFGAVREGATLSWRVSVDNPTKFNMLLSGFDRPCGIIARYKGNPVIPPFGKLDIELTTNTGRRPGPAGSVLTLTKQSGKNTSTVRYIMTYVVVPPVWVTASEIWCNGNAGQQTITCVNGTVETVNAPPGWTATVKDGTSGREVNLSYPAMAHDTQVIMRARGSGGPVTLVIPVRVLPTASHRVYPEKVCLAIGSKKTVTVLGMKPWTAKAQSTAIEVRSTGEGRLELRRIKSGPVSVCIQDPQGTILGRLEVL